MSKVTFEEGMQELEALVRSLETGSLPLERSFEAYERAKQLQKALEQMLDEGDTRIRVLTEDGDRPIREVEKP